MNKLFVSLAFAVAASAAVAQSSCIVTEYGTSLGSLNDTIYPGVSIGFAFPLDGSTYTDIHVSDHGFAFLSNAGVPTVPAGGAITFNVLTADFIGNGPCLSPFWTDSNNGYAPNALGEVFINSTPTECTVSWVDMWTYFNVGPQFTYQMTLFLNGSVVFRYNPTVQNIGSTFAPNAIVGITPGSPAVLPTSSDLSAPSTTTTDVTVFEEFATASTFDLADNGLLFVPTNPGWSVVPLGPPASCATVEAYGLGCVSSFKSFYEQMPSAGFDLVAGTTVSLIRLSNGYVALDSIPGAFVTPTATALAVAVGDDVEETVALSSAMPIAGGTTMNLTVCSNGRIALSAAGNGTDFSPSQLEFLAFTEPSLAPLWHDLNPTGGGGGITFEEVAGIAYVTWNDVWSYGTTGPGDTFQVQFNVATGDITIVYQTVVNLGGTAYGVGYKAGGTALDPGVFDLSVDLATPIDVGDVDIEPLALTSNRPVIGSDWNLTTTNIDALSPLTVTFFGDGRIPGFPAGLPLSSIGIPAPGCFVHINQILGDLVGLSVGGVSTVTFSIPNTPAFAGSILTVQSLCLTTVNLANILTSNGVEGQLDLN